MIQAGSESDAAIITKSGIVTNFYIWHEAWPQQPTAHEFASISPGDLISVYVYVGDSSGKIDPSGNYAYLTIQDQTVWQKYSASTKLGSSFGFSATSAEWIIERPFVSGAFPELSDYSFLEMTGAYVLPATGTTMIPYSKAENVQLTMRGNYDGPWYDNNVLSTVTGDSYCSNCMWFYWKNFH